MSRVVRGETPASTGEATDFGGWLRQEREARNVPLVDVAQRTRVKLQYLELIEANQLEELPAEVFVRGFVRAYARALGADDKRASALLSAYLSERAGAGSLLTGSVRRRAIARRGRIVAAVLAAIVLAAIAIAVALVSRR